MARLGKREPEVYEHLMKYNQQKHFLALRNM